MVKNPPSNAEDIGSIPSQRTKIPHATGQLSPQATMKTQHSHIFFFKKEVTITVVETRELKLEVEPEDVNELL